MKRTVLAILFICCAIVSLKAQVDCLDAAPFCTSTGVSYPAGVNNGDAAIGPDYECLLTQPNPAWYYLNISQAGNINISLTNNAGVDIDFIIWGPFNNINCNNNQLTSSGGLVAYPTLVEMLSTAVTAQRLVKRLTYPMLR